ncbi:MAG: FAD:protein FMN transferase [Lachnospiraceae bacterium]|nr:FAD:protein FMN transferase [Lachnospiraceae bacterium]
MDKKRIIRITICGLTALAILIAAFLMNKSPKSITKEGYYFDTYVNLTVYSKKDAKYLDECLKMCQRYENLFSRTIEGSDIYNINHSSGKSVEVDEETYILLKEALEFCEKTNGAADITIAPLTDAWGFNKNAAFVNEKPSDEDIAKALNKVDYKCVKLEEGYKVRLDNPDAAIDLGFIAKGYIADRLREYLVSKNVKSAIISLGGNIVVIGTKIDGSDYNIGIKDPDNNENILGSVKVNDKSVVTSGTYERYVEYDGVRYHHILDTLTGYPVDNGIKSVTIVSDSSAEGDALSTICLILGEEKSKDILEEYDAKAIFY